jgi:catechol 2,3-dioxygenase-like lactoylglutathione lyase family enzyme
MGDGFRIEAIDHVQLAMPPGCEPEAVAFYQDVLGVPQIPKPAELALRGGCWFELGTLRLHLGAEEGFTPARKAHPALVVSGIDQLCAALEAAGHAVRTVEDVPGMVQRFTSDPFGNRIELVAAETYVAGESIP